MIRRPVQGDYPKSPPPNLREKVGEGPSGHGVEATTSPKTFRPASSDIANRKSEGPAPLPLLTKLDQGIDLQKALAEAQPEEQRGVLLAALNHFAEVKDSQKVSEIVALLELSLPMMETPAADSLQLYTLMYQSLKGTGLPEESEVKKKGKGLANGLVNSQAPIATRAKQAILAREFFQLCEEGEEVARYDQTLLKIQEEIRQALQGKTDLRPKERRELARLGVQIDQELLPLYLAEASHPDYQGPKIGDRVLPRIKQLREEMLAGEGGSLEQRLTDGALLAQALAPLKAFIGGDAAQVERDAWRTERDQLQLAMGKIFSESMAQEAGVDEVQTQLAKSIVQDLQFRFNEALENSDLGYLRKMNGAEILAFARRSQLAHIQLKKLQDPQANPAVDYYLQVAALFGDLGLRDRVRETLSPLKEKAPSLEPVELRALLYFQLGQAYQCAGMDGEAKEAWDEIVGLNKKVENPQVDALAKRAYLYRLLQGGKIAEAEEYLRGLPESAEKQSLLGQLGEGLKAHRLMGGIQILAGALNDFRSSFYQDDPETRALFDGSIQSILGKTYELVSTGAAPDIKSAFERSLEGSGFATPLKNFLFESPEATRLFALLNGFTDPNIGDQNLITESMKLLSTFSARNYFQAVVEISRFIESHPRAGEESVQWAKERREEIPTSALFNSAMFGAQELIAMTSWLGNVVNPNIKMDQGFFFRAGMTVGTLGIARGVGVGAQALWVARMENIVTSPVTFRLSTIGVRSLSEAAAFPLAGMGFQSIITGRTDHWSLEHFGKEFGSGLVMFSILNAGSLGLAWGGARTGEAVKAAQQALEKAKTAGGNLAAAQSQLARANLAYSVMRSGTTAWATRVGAFTGSSYVNQRIGLNDREKGANLASRLIHSAVTDKQMMVGGKIVDAVSGGKLGKMERATELRLQQHFVRQQVFKDGGPGSALKVFFEGLVQEDQVAVTPEGIVFKMKGRVEKGPSRKTGAKTGEAKKTTRTAKRGKGGGPSRVHRLIEQMASELHDQWRAPRLKSNGGYEPRIKPTKDREWINKHKGKKEVDIANTSYKDLPSDWQAENRASAIAAMGEVIKEAVEGGELDELFLEEASAKVHARWLERNQGWAGPHQKLEYEKLSPAQKELDRDFGRLAMQVHELKRITKILEKRYGRAKRDYVLGFLEENQASPTQIATLRLFLEGRFDTEDPVDLVHYVVRELPKEDGSDVKASSRLAEDLVGEAYGHRALNGKFIEEAAAMVYRKALERRKASGEKFTEKPMDWRPYEKLYPHQKKPIREYVLGAMLDLGLMGIGEVVQKRHGDAKREEVLNFLLENDASPNQIARLKRSLGSSKQGKRNPMVLARDVLKKVPREDKYPEAELPVFRDPRDDGLSFFSLNIAVNRAQQARDLEAARGYYRSLPGPTSPPS